MGEFKICVTYFIRLDGKVRDSDALVRKVSGGMRGFRKKENEKEDKKKKKRKWERVGKKKGKEPFLFLSAFVSTLFFLSTYILAHQLDILPDHCIYDKNYNFNCSHWRTIVKRTFLTKMLKFASNV